MSEENNETPSWLILTMKTVLSTLIVVLVLLVLLMFMLNTKVDISTYNGNITAHGTATVKDWIANKDCVTIYNIETSDGYKYQKVLDCDSKKYWGKNE